MQGSSMWLKPRPMRNAPANFYFTKGLLINKNCRMLRKNTVTCLAVFYPARHLINNNNNSNDDTLLIIFTSVLMKCYFDQQAKAHPKTASLDSVILILWYLDQNDPTHLWKFRTKPTGKTAFWLKAFTNTGPWCI